MGLFSKLSDIGKGMKIANNWERWKNIRYKGEELVPYQETEEIPIEMVARWDKVGELIESIERYLQKLIQRDAYVGNVEKREEAVAQREATLNEKAEALQQMKIQLDQKERSLKEKEQSINAEKNNLDRRKAAIDSEVQEKVDIEIQKLSDKEVAVGKRELAVSKREQLVELEVQQRLDDEKVKLRDREAAVSEREVDVRNKEAAVSEREVDVRNKEEALKPKRFVITGVRKETDLNRVGHWTAKDLKKNVMSEISDIVNKTGMTREEATIFFTDINGGVIDTIGREYLKYEEKVENKKFDNEHEMAASANIGQMSKISNSRNSILRVESSTIIKSIVAAAENLQFPVYELVEDRVKAYEDQNLSPEHKKLIQDVNENALLEAMLTYLQREQPEELKGMIEQAK